MGFDNLWVKNKALKRPYFHFLLCHDHLFKVIVS